MSIKTSKKNFILINNNLREKYRGKDRIVPLAGYRKQIHCENSCNNSHTTIIHKDNYALCTNCSGKRTAKPLIRSGVQPSKDSSGRLTEYSYSYREFLNNKKQITYNRKLKNKLKDANKNLYSNSGGNCYNNCINETTYKVNNKNFSKQGSVDSSLRLLRLKQQTIVNGSKCPNNNNCNGVYFAGKPRFTGYIFNNNHKEINCPQNTAKGKARGHTSNTC